MLTAKNSNSVSIVIDGEWIRCGRCGRKLARIIDRKRLKGAVVMPPPNETIEFKCPSCKSINLY